MAGRQHNAAASAPLRLREGAGSDSRDLAVDDRERRRFTYQPGQGRPELLAIGKHGKRTRPRRHTTETNGVEQK